MNSNNCLSLLRISKFVAVSLLLHCWASVDPAQTVVGTLPTGRGPRAVAVNSATNKIYIAGGPVGGNVTVIDGATDSTSTVATGGRNGSIGLAVNPVTNRIYVVNQGGGNVVPVYQGSITVIDGDTNAIVQTIGVTGGIDQSSGLFPVAVAVNPVTNKIYVAGSHGVTVIDGATNSTTTISDPNVIAIGLFPVAVAVNLKTNKIYVANNNGVGSTTSNPGNLTVIDGLTNSTTTITDPNAVYPVDIAVNSTTNEIYVANKGDYPGSNHGNITVIDGVTNLVTTVTDVNALAPQVIKVNEITNKIYVANANDSALTGKGSVTVIDGATNSVSSVANPHAIYPHALAVDSVTNTIYVANGGCHFLSGCTDPGSVTVINGATNSVRTVTDSSGNTPNSIAVNEMTDKIYVANFLSDNATVIDGSAAPTSYILSVLLAGSGSGTVASNPAGIDCGTSCSLSFATGTTLSLTASPAAGSEFSGWSGACAGIGGCNVTMTAAELVRANFNVPDFSLQPASASLTAQRGSQITDVITVAPLNGVSFGGAIQLSCAVQAIVNASLVPAQMATCALSPTSVTPGANTATSTLTVAAPLQSAGLTPFNEGHLAGSLRATFVPLLGIVLIVLSAIRGKSPNRRRSLWPLCSLFIAVLVLLAGCGGGSSSQQVQPQNYIVTVTATSGALQHTTQVSVTIQ